MGKTEIQLPDRIDSEIDRLVADGEFLNREKALEELLSRGVSAYESSGASEEEPYDEWGMQGPDERQDPSLQGDTDDTRQF